MRDNGVGFQVGAGTSGSGIGLANIRSRLAAVYGSGASMVLLQGDPSGVIARVEITKQSAVDVSAHMVSGIYPVGSQDERAAA